MRKKRDWICLWGMVVFLLVNLLFLWNIVQDVTYVSDIQETTGIIVHVEEKDHNWDIGRACEFGYTVNGIYYRGKFTYFGKGISPELELGKQIAVSYCRGIPENARQGSVVKVIGIFVLKCSVYVFGNMLVILGFIMHMTLCLRAKVAVPVVALR